jgi:hypothetical protein
MEVEIANRDGRLKPGMYARVDLMVEDKDNVLVVPKISLVDSGGERGVFQPSEDNKAKFKAVKIGIENNETAEILEGLADGEVIIGTGAGALRRDDQLAIAGQPAGPGGGRGGRGRGNRGGGGQGNQPDLQRNNPQPDQQQAPDGDGPSRGRRGQSENDPAGRRPPQSMSIQRQRPIA